MGRGIINLSIDDAEWQLFQLKYPRRGSAIIRDFIRHMNGVANGQEINDALELEQKADELRKKQHEINIQLQSLDEKKKHLNGVDLQQQQADMERAYAYAQTVEALRRAQRQNEN